MLLTTSTKSFEKQIDNIIKYSSGFLDGVQKGKTSFLKTLGQATITSMAQYVDAQARSNPSALHHIYEWNRVGSPSARLFDLHYTISNLGLSIGGTFSQSRTVKDDSNVPFYDKAKIMEKGIPVTITPKKRVLAFEVGGNTVFTPNSVTVNNPGGNEVQGSFENTIDEFIRFYFKQSFLRASGIYDYIKKPVLYKKEFRSFFHFQKSIPQLGIVIE